MKSKEPILKDKTYYWLIDNGWTSNGLAGNHELWIKRFDTKKHSRKQAVEAQKKYDRFWGKL